MAELTQKQLEEMVNPTPGKGHAIFFEKAQLDHARSMEAGRRMYRTKVYIQVFQPGVTDTISTEATDKDIAAWPAEFAHFERTRQGKKKSPGVGMIPNLPLDHMQELVDLGFDTIEALATALEVPAHLAYAQRSAIAIHTVLEEQDNGKEESHHEERTETLSQADRQEYPRPVGQRSLPEGGRDQDRKAAEGVRPSRRLHGGQGQLEVNQLDNWSIEFPV